MGNTLDKCGVCKQNEQMDFARAPKERTYSDPQLSESFATDRGSFHTPKAEKSKRVLLSDRIEETKGSLPKPPPLVGYFSLDID